MYKEIEKIKSKLFIFQFGEIVGYSFLYGWSLFLAGKIPEGTFGEGITLEMINDSIVTSIIAIYFLFMIVKLCALLSDRDYNNVGSHLLSTVGGIVKIMLFANVIMLLLAAEILPVLGLIGFIIALKNWRENSEVKNSIEVSEAIKKELIINWEQNRVFASDKLVKDEKIDNVSFAFKKWLTPITDNSFEMKDIGMLEVNIYIDGENHQFTYNKLDSKPEPSMFAKAVGFCVYKFKK